MITQDNHQELIPKIKKTLQKNKDKKATTNRKKVTSKYQSTRMTASTTQTIEVPHQDPISSNTKRQRQLKHRPKHPTA
jgi:hypothetical protein